MTGCAPYRCGLPDVERASRFTNPSTNRRSVSRVPPRRGGARRVSSCSGARQHQDVASREGEDAWKGVVLRRASRRPGGRHATGYHPSTLRATNSRTPAQVRLSSAVRSHRGPSHRRGTGRLEEVPLLRDHPPQLLADSVRVLGALAPEVVAEG